MFRIHSFKMKIISLILLISCCKLSAQESNFQDSVTVFISSEPDSAMVYIGSKKAGTTPFLFRGKYNDTLNITIGKQYYDSWNTRLVLTEGNEFEIIATLKKRETKLNIFVEPNNSSVYLNDNYITTGSITEYPVRTGLNKITVANDSIKRKLDLITNFNQGMTYSFESKLGVPSFTRGLFSFLLPGSIQISDGSYIKGTLFLIGSIFLAYNAINSQQDYNDALEKYDLAWLQYINANSETLALRRHQEVEMKNSNLDKYNLIRAISFSALAAVYIYSIVDTFLNHLISDRIEIVTPMRYDLTSLDFGAQLKIKL